MYSLYRAWLACAPPLAPPPPHGLPDIHLLVGPTLTRFSAHRAILCTHSGYLKAALTTAGLGHQHHLTLPNVNADEFSALLTFMYTGQLDLTAGNIYGVLLATHILHMPIALEMCREFLLARQQQQQQGTTTVVRPIATMTSGVQEATPQQHHHHHQEQHSTATPTVRLPRSEPTPFRAVAGPSSSSAAAKLQPVVVVKKRPPVVDVACCDGPVRFQRILNANYDHNNDEEGGGGSSGAASLADGQEYTCAHCRHTFKSRYCYQKHARRHINPPAETAAADKRDMNVQYYPCKTCGGKFPSYYFVHKHRRTCHASSSPPPTGENNNNTNNAPVSSPLSSTSSDISDV